MLVQLCNFKQADTCWGTWWTSRINAQDPWIFVELMLIRNPATSDRGIVFTPLKDTHSGAPVITEAIQEAYTDFQGKDFLYVINLNYLLIHVLS